MKNKYNDFVQIYGMRIVPPIKKLYFGESFSITLRILIMKNDSIILYLVAITMKLQ